MFKKFTNKKLAIGIAASAAVLIAAVGYFVVTPAMQVGGYKQSLNTAHTKLSTAVDKLIAVQGSDTFIKTDVESSVIRNDVKNGQDAIKDVEAALASYEPQLTGLTVLPLLDWNSAYKIATQLKSQEQDYIKNTRDYLAEMRGIIDYYDKAATVMDKTAEIKVISAGIENAVSMEELEAKLNQLTQKFDEVIADIEKLSAPESLKDIHNTSVDGMKELNGILKQLIAAFKAEDYTKMQKDYTTLTAKYAEYDKKVGDLNSAFLKESKLVKLSDGLKNSNRSIQADLNKL